MLHVAAAFNMKQQYIERVIDGVCEFFASRKYPQEKRPISSSLFPSQTSIPMIAVK